MLQWNRRSSWIHWFIKKKFLNRFPVDKEKSKRQRDIVPILFSLEAGFIFLLDRKNFCLKKHFSWKETISARIERHEEEQKKDTYVFSRSFHFSLIWMTLCGGKHFSINWNNFPIDWSSRPLLNYFVLLSALFSLQSCLLHCKWLIEKHKTCAWLLQKTNSNDWVIQYVWLSKLSYRAIRNSMFRDVHIEEFSVDADVDIQLSRLHHKQINIVFRSVLP